MMMMMMMMMMMNRSMKEILGEDDGCMYQYFFHIAPNKASKSETDKEVWETEKVSGKPIKTDNFIIDGKEYDTELINKALKRATILKNAIDKGIITEEEYNQALDDLAISVERERQEQELEKYYQNILKGLRTAGDVAGEYIQTILDRIREAYQAEKEEQTETNVEGEEQEKERQKEGMIKTHIRYCMYEDAWKIQKWLKENWPDYVIKINSDYISVVNRKVENEQ